MGAIECYACGSTLKDPVVLGRRGSMPADFNGKLTHLPRRLDGHHEQSVSAVTVGRYKKHLADFVQFLRREQLNPSTREELDAHLVSFKNSGNITRSKLEQTISALLSSLSRKSRVLSNGQSACWLAWSLPRQ